MKVQLFGVGVKSISPAITAQRRINCYVEPRQEHEKTTYSLVRRPGLNPFVSSLGANPARGIWGVNSLASPLFFVVVSNNLYSVDNGGNVSSIGTINTSAGNVSIADDGRYLVIVDGQDGWYYNMQAPAGLIRITDGNFTTSPAYVTWQDTYFIVVSGKSNQFQLSKNADPSTWPAVQINFTGSAPGFLKAGLADHSILQLFGDFYTEYWQDAGTPDFPYAVIPGAAAEFGLASAWSLAKFDGKLAGLFQSKMGGVSVAIVTGFHLTPISNADIDQILSGYAVTGDAIGYGFKENGHSFYVLSFPTQGATWMYDANSQIWSELQGNLGANFTGRFFTYFQTNLLVTDANSANIYSFSPTTYTDNGTIMPMEVWSKHIWQDDKYIGIPRIQIDVQAGVGLAVGQGSNPMLDLQVSKDGGNTFMSIGFSSIGKVGAYTQRVIWNGLGAARDWVLRLRITDPVKCVITGATAEITGAKF